MTISAAQSIIIISICALCTFSERLLPFAIFGKRKIPPVINYLGEALPMAVITTLVIYCLRSAEFSSLSGFLPQAISVAVTAVLHLWRGSTLISVLGGTACYMTLIHYVF